MSHPISWNFWSKCISLKNAPRPDPTACATALQGMKLGVTADVNQHQSSMRKAWAEAVKGFVGCGLCAVILGTVNWSTGPSWVKYDIWIFLNNNMLGLFGAAMTDTPDDDLQLQSSLKDTSNWRTPPYQSLYQPKWLWKKHQNHQRSKNPVFGGGPCKLRVAKFKTRLLLKKPWNLHLQKADGMHIFLYAHWYIIHINLTIIPSPLDRRGGSLLNTLGPSLRGPRSWLYWTTQQGWWFRVLMGTHGPTHPWLRPNSRKSELIKGLLNTTWPACCSNM